jgi:hypothetical protein
MTIPNEHWFAILGFAVSGILATLVTCVIMFVVVVLAIRYTPRLHWGVPKASIELRSFSRATVVTGKDRKPLPPGGEWREFQRLAVARWYGLSSRNSARWFFGLTIFSREEK